MLMENPQIEERFSSIALDDFRGDGGEGLLVDGQFPDHALEPVYGEVVVVLVLLFHDGGLVHEFVGELDLAFVVAFYAALVE